MKWKIGNMVPISSKNVKGFFETKKPSNQEALRPRNNKPRNHKPRNQNTRILELKKPRSQDIFVLFK